MLPAGVRGAYTFLCCRVVGRDYYCAYHCSFCEGKELYDTICQLIPKLKTRQGGGGGGGGGGSRTGGAEQTTGGGSGGGGGAGGGGAQTGSKKKKGRRK